MSKIERRSLRPQPQKPADPLAKKAIGYRTKLEQPVELSSPTVQFPNPY
jgi:hypothetical protein